MKRLYIVKAGTTFSATEKQFGDFDIWTRAGLGTVGTEICTLDVRRGKVVLPVAEVCAGVVITGSHEMVTDAPAWSVALEKWIPSLLKARVPLLGICYGHQLLARAAGGRVVSHPRGMEIGTVTVRLLETGPKDTLFSSLPGEFGAQVTHAQTVSRLPSGAVCLAANDYEPHQAYRLGDCAWGVQFHPEFSAAVTRSYIREQAGELKAAGQDIARLLAAVADTPAAGKILENFAAIVSGTLNEEDGPLSAGRYQPPDPLPASSPGSRFDPFENRLCRDIRNELSENVLAIIRDGRAAALPGGIKPSVPEGAAPHIRDYIQNRLQRYQTVGTQIRAARIQPAEFYAVALLLWDQGLLFEAHEWIEEPWIKSSGSEKGACQALILAAGTYQHLEYGREAAARKMASRALQKLVQFGNSLPRYFDLDLLVAGLEALDSVPPQLGAARLVAERAGKPK